MKIMQINDDNMGHLGGLDEDAIADEIMRFHDSTEPIGVHLERNGYWQPRHEGVAVVRSYVPEFIGMTLLHGDYTDSAGTVSRSPVRAHADTERMLGRRVNVLAEVIFDQKLLDLLQGKTLTEVVEADMGAAVVFLKGSRIDAAHRILERAKYSDSLAVATAHGIDRLLVDRMQQKAEVFAQAADQVKLLERAGVVYGRPLVKPLDYYTRSSNVAKPVVPTSRGYQETIRPHPIQNSAERDKAIKALVAENPGIPRHLLERSYDAKAKKLS